MDAKDGYFTRHMEAMTAEDLHSKYAIAAELGFRDMLIDFLAERTREVEGLLVGLLKAHDLHKLAEARSEAGVPTMEGVLFNMLYSIAEAKARDFAGLPSAKEIDDMIAEQIEADNTVDA
jgi:hypothetical protein